MRIVTAAVLAVYLLALIVAGVLVTRRMKGFGEYVTGGGRIPAWMLALSFMANFVSSNSFVGHAAKSYEVGLGWCVVGAFLVAACVLSFHVFAPRFAAFAQEHRAETLPDFFEKRFGSRPLAVLVQWVVVGTTLLYVLAVMRGTALVVTSGLGISYEVALVVLYGVTIVYCLLGGLWADVWTDVIQAVILLFGAIGLFVGVLVTAPDAAGVAPPALRPAPVGLLVVLGCLFPLGYFARELLPSVGQVEELVPRLVFERRVLGAAFGPVFLVALFAASMSSLDSSLLVMASCLEKHVAAPLMRSEPSTKRARVLLFAVATLVLALSWRPLGGIVELSTLAGALLGASLLPAICAGLGARRVPARTAALSVVLGLAGAIAGKLAPAALGVRSPWLQDIFVGLLAATLPLLPSLLRRPRLVSDAG